MSGFKSYYTGTKPIIGENVPLDKFESHHLVEVLRAKNDDRVTLFDGNELVWEGMLNICSRKGFVKILSENTIEKPKCPIILAQAMPKGKGMEEILQKATEIGVQTIIPLKTDRTELKLDQERESKRMERWKATLIEACKQSGNFLLPHIMPILKIKDFLNSYKSLKDTLKLTASLEGESKLLKDYLTEEVPNSITWLVGPEGDFTKEEYELAFNTGFNPVCLARNVLRVETATTYALSITDYELQVRKIKSNSK